MKTDLNLVTRSELAQHLNISLSYVDKLRTQGVFRYVKGTKFDLPESVRALRALRKRDTGYLESVLRRTLSRAELAKQRLSNLQHKCTNLEDARWSHDSMRAQFIKIAEKYSVAVAPRLDGIKSPAVAEEILEETIFELMRSVQEAWELLELEIEAQTPEEDPEPVVQVDSIEEKIEQARIRLNNYVAEFNELKAELAGGRALYTADWERVLTLRISVAKSKLLGIPNMAAIELPGLKADAIEDRLRGKINSAIAEFKPFDVEECKSKDIEYALEADELEDTEPRHEAESLRKGEPAETGDSEEAASNRRLPPRSPSDGPNCLAAVLSPSLQLAQ